MCGTCVTTFDAVSWNSAFGLAVVAEGARRIRLRYSGGDRSEAALRSWTENAEFVTSMGLDPLAVLGAPPTVPNDHHRSVSAAVDDA